MPILKIQEHDKDAEIEFELAFQRSLTVQQRFAMLEERRIATLKQLVRYGYRKPFEITKRS